MTDKDEICDRIQDLTGEGSPEFTRAMFDILTAEGYLAFDADHGYVLSLPEWNDDGASWNKLLDRADAIARCAPVDEDSDGPDEATRKFTLGF